MFLLNVSKVFGVAGIIAVAANTFAFLRIHRRKLAPFENPIDESQEVLASFPVNKDVDDDGFFFAISTASALLEEDACLKFAAEHGDYPEEIKPEPKDGNQSILSESQTGLKVRSSEQLGEDTESKGGNGGQNLENASTLCAKNLSEHHQIKEGGRHNKDLYEMPLGEWELLNYEQMAEKEQWSREQVSRFPSVAGLGKSEVENIDLYDPKGLHKCYDQHLELLGSIEGKGEKLLDPTPEGLMKGLENVTDEQKGVATQPKVSYLEEKPCSWSDPDRELQLAKGTNATVFHMGIDWNRIMPEEPLDGFEKAINRKALDRYRCKIERVRAHGLRVMLTLFHQSLPTWACAYGGWKKDKTIDYFLQYTRLIVDRFYDLVDFWITFNEPHVFALTTYCFSGPANLFQVAATALRQRVYRSTINRMATAHIKAYDIIHDTRSKTSRNVSVGIAHHTSFMRPYGFFDIPTVEFNNWMTCFGYVDHVFSKLDFLGINYYGQEFISSVGLKLVENEEYSESGRSIYPDGLYRVLLDFHNRYKKFNVPFIITENGVADATDILRRPYILEHLLAVKAAMNKGVPVKGYCFWALSDNWESANGHSFKFGLAAIDSDNNLKYITQPSYYIFSEVAKSGSITKGQRDKAWDELQTVIEQGNNRFIFFGSDAQGAMHAGRVENRIKRPFVKKDWRFGHYRPDGLQDPVSRTMRWICRAPHMISTRQEGS